MERFIIQLIFTRETHINGIDVSKLTADEVENAIKDYELTITEKR